MTIIDFIGARALFKYFPVEWSIPMALGFGSTSVTNISQPSASNTSKVPPPPTPPNASVATEATKALVRDVASQRSYQTTVLTRQRDHLIPGAINGVMDPHIFLGGYDSPAFTTPTGTSGGSGFVPPPSGAAGGPAPLGSTLPIDSFPTAGPDWGGGGLNSVAPSGEIPGSPQVPNSVVYGTDPSVTSPSLASGAFGPSAADLFLLTDGIQSKYGRGANASNWINSYL